MPSRLLVKIVQAAVRHAWPVVAAFALLVALSGAYVARHVAITTDVGKLIDATAPWARREAAIGAAFPSRGDTTLVLVRAPAPEFAAQAARELAARLRAEPRLFRSVGLGAGDDFFRRNALLYLRSQDLDRLCGRLVDARPLLRALAQDPSLRGLSNLLSVSLSTPLQTGQLTLAGMAPLLARSAATVEALLAGRPAALSWQDAFNAADDAGAHRTRAPPAMIDVQPVLDYGQLLPGAPSSAAIRSAAAALHLDVRYGANVSLTGPVPLSDDEFASLREGSLLAGALPVAVALVLLWLALRSGRLVLALCVTMLGGLALTAALGLWMVGALNLISIAFAILFVGLGIDFGIQFGARFRSLRRRRPDAPTALADTARSIASALSLAGLATALGFLAFLPTDYRGVAELGLIAGVGIACVALPACLTVLPALIRLIDPPPSRRPPGWPRLAPLDRVLQAHRKALLAGTIAVVGAGMPLLWRLEFDANPLHLKDPGSESMAALDWLAQAAGTDATGIDNVQVLAPSVVAATALAARLARLPEVASARTGLSLVPDDQPAKLRAVARVAATLAPVLDETPRFAGADGQRAAALRGAALALRNAALDHPGPGAAQAMRLSAALAALARTDTATRARVERAVAEPLRLVLAALREALRPQPVTLASLPDALRRGWIARDGRALVDVTPALSAHAAVATADTPGAAAGYSAGTSAETIPGTASGAVVDRNAALRRFGDAVLAVAPDATGGPIALGHAADLIVRAFLQAALLAVAAIALLLWLRFRRLGDVMRTLVPLLVSSLVTLEACVLLGIRLNFANIIALPLLLGVGVAFKIYYVMAWRAGHQVSLADPLSEAVVLSAATTGTAFGSLWLSHHPGTASMGKLLVLSLVCTLIGAVFFQPILLGKPRRPSQAPSLHVPQP